MCVCVCVCVQMSFLVLVGHRFQHRLDAKANPDHVNVYGNTALHFAAPAGRHEACELLMKAGAKNTFANNCNKTALQ